MRKTHNRQSGSRIAKLGATILFAHAQCLFAQATLKASVDQKSGAYSITAPAIQGPVLSASPAILVGGKWIAGRDYPRHRIQDAPVEGPLGDATEQTVSYTGLAGAPDLIFRIRTYNANPFGEIQLAAGNTTGLTQHIERLRLLDALGPEVLNLGGEPASDRVLSECASTPPESPVPRVSRVAR